ncbi:MAG: MoxR family ATPase [Acidimicrobiales bacterium]
MALITQEEATWFSHVYDGMVANIERAIIGKTDVIKSAVACLFSQGHLLLEDVTGSGKTTLARALARGVYGSQSRIQFTADLQPSDITGVVLFDERTDRYRLHPGPIFNSIIVADEINRASPRTQSALLEVMEEGRVTVQGVTNTVGPPFMVIATQNPIDHEGTFPLPVAQLDRFLLRLHLGYPDPDSTVRLLDEAAIRDRSSLIEPILDTPSLAKACAIANCVYVDPSVLRYVVDLTEATRHTDSVVNGISVRGAMSFVRAVKTWAVAHGRTHVLPRDVQELAHQVLEHRIMVRPDAQRDGVTATSVIDDVLAKTPEPTG